MEKQLSNKKLTCSLMITDMNIAMFILEQIIA